MDHDELERWLDDELTKLPAPRAPGSLAPRVMQAVRAGRPDAPASRSWLNWPLTQQIASAAALVVSLAAVAGLWLFIRDPLLSVIGPPVVAATSRVVDLQQRAYDLTLAARLLWRVLEPFAVGATALVAIMFAVCAVIGAALRNLAVGGTSA